MRLMFRVLFGIFSTGVFIFFILVLLGIVRIGVASGLSMYPTYRTGDLCICVSKNIMPISVGDVAMYIDNGTRILHRVIQINNSTYVFKGDNNLALEYVPEDHVMCKAIVVIPALYWITGVATLVSLFVVNIFERGRHISILVLFMVMIIVVASFAISDTSTETLLVAGYSKPVNHPRIYSTYYDLDTGTLQVKFTVPLNGQVTCYSDHQLQCFINGTSVIIKNISLPAGKITILYKPYALYNVTIKYII